MTTPFKFTSAIREFSTSQFSFADNKFVEECSTLLGKDGKLPDYIYLKSAKTGEVVIFQKQKEEMRDAENDITGWQYNCSEHGKEHLTIVILND